MYLEGLFLWSSTLILAFLSDSDNDLHQKCVSLVSLLLTGEHRCVNISPPSAHFIKKMTE